MKKLTAWFGLGVSYLIVKSPTWVRKFLGGLLGLLWFDVFRIRRKIVLENITRAFPEMTHKEKVKLGRSSLINMGWNFVDYAFLPWLTKENYRELFEIRNPEVIDRAFRGHGVLMLTLHVGHGDLATAALSLSGYKTYLVSKIFKMAWLNDLWFGMRRRLGTEFIPARNSAFPLLKALKNNALVILPLDQFTGPPIGVRTTFFGHETGTAAGFALMAHRSKATVLVAYPARNAEGKHVIYFVKELPVPLVEGNEQSLIDVTQSFNNELEEIVRKHPEQWMWIHRRWKRFVVQ